MSPEDANASADRERFVLANTRPRPVPLCPEIALHVADEAFDLWFKTEDELEQQGLPPPYWAFAWAGGQALARYVLDHPDFVTCRRVLDLGAGSGLVAIAAARAGAACVIAADTDPWAAAACRLNAEVAGATLTIVTDDLLGTLAETYDVILVGDLFYDRDLASRTLAFIERAATSGAEVLIGDPGRSYLPAHCLSRLAAYGVPTTWALEDAEIKRTTVWRLGAE